MSWKKAHRRNKPKNYKQRVYKRNRFDVTIHTYLRGDGTYGYYVDPKHAERGLKTTFNEFSGGASVTFEYQTRGGGYRQIGEGSVVDVDTRMEIDNEKKYAHQEFLRNLKKTPLGNIHLGMIEGISFTRFSDPTVIVSGVTGMYGGPWSYGLAKDPRIGKLYPEHLLIFTMDFSEHCNGSALNHLKGWVEYLGEIEATPVALSPAGNILYAQTPGKDWVGEAKARNGVGTLVNWDELDKKPAAFPPLSHAAIGNGDDPSNVIDINIPKK